MSNSLKADDRPVKANYVITVADDFLVDVYVNGTVVPDARRHMLAERFGATSERIDVELCSGDWIVFHVVNDRLRWNGSYYFAAAGVFDKGEFGFVSELGTDNWSACDNPAKANKFVAKKDFMSDKPVQKITNAWGDGQGLMKNFAGDSWNGDPIWGHSRDTWLKYIVP